MTLMPLTKLASGPKDGISSNVTQTFLTYNTNLLGTTLHALLCSHIMHLACLSVCLSVSAVFPSVPYALLTHRQKDIYK